MLPQGDSWEDADEESVSVLVLKTENVKQKYWDWLGSFKSSVNWWFMWRLIATETLLLFILFCIKMNTSM